MIDETVLKKNDTTANRKNYTGFGLMSKEMAIFPEAPKRRNNDWNELWRRRKMKAKTKARERGMT